MNDRYLSTKEVARRVREQLKSEYPEWKFSVTYKGYSMGSSIDLKLMSGPVDVIEKSLSDASLQGYAQLNQYQLSRPEEMKGYNNGVLLTPAGWDIMSKAYAVISSYHWDDSEPQTDYFSCNFYIHLGIGKWDKGYAVKGAK